VITYNAALNRPAYQSSEYHDPQPAHFANDGSRHTTPNTSPYCAATKFEANPWWAVDLGQPMTIHRVDLTSSVYDVSCKKTNITALDLVDL